MKTKKPVFIMFKTINHFHAKNNILMKKNYFQNRLMRRVALFNILKTSLI